MRDNVAFSRIMEEYGLLEQQETRTSVEETAQASEADPSAEKVKDILMQEEERYRGSVTWKTYRDYLRFAGSSLWGPVFLILLILNECSSGWFSHLSTEAC